MKKIFFITLLVFLASLSSALAADFYVVYDLSYEAGAPGNVYVTGGACNDATCTNLGQAVEVFTSAAANCLYNYDPNSFENCVSAHKISNGVISGSQVVVKYDTTKPFGYNTYFFASGDSYLPDFFRITDFTCNFNVCFTDGVNVDMEKKANAIAEIQQINLLNVDNPNLPIQVEVPIQIEETVCSAFQFTNPQMYRPTPPAGYSDYSANTEVNLRVSKTSDGAIFKDETITLPIEASTCAGLAAFSWTPPNSFEGEEVRFGITTDVIDNQVSSSVQDYAEVLETVYPVDLTNACWTRAYDFTLSNIATTSLNTSIAQITEGESLYLLFRAEAFKDDETNPIDFRARALFNRVEIYNQVHSSNGHLQTYTLDLSQHISNLNPGFYNVTLITSPVASGCSVSEDVIQSQNLWIQPVEEYTVNFYVNDQNDTSIEGASVNLELLDADDHFVTDPTYDRTLTTDAQGRLFFNDVIAGDYRYTVSADGFTTVDNIIHIASDMNVYVTLINSSLDDSNREPVIDLPGTFTEDYRNAVVIDMQQYASDADDSFDTLDFTFTKISGVATLSFNGRFLAVTTTKENDVVIRATVEDPQGATASDTTTIRFVENEKPVINTFRAEPDNGEAPFNTNFRIDVDDFETEDLQCTIEFGDGSEMSDLCEDLDGVSHTYNTVGTYNAVLEVRDGTHEVTATEQVFVFEREGEAPIINLFQVESSNGSFVPTDLTIRWNVTHSAGDAMNCTLRINGIDQSVNCIDTLVIDDFTREGTSTFTIVAIDANGVQVLRTITRTFIRLQPLSEADARLIIDDVIEPGEFSFSLEILNETLERRLVDVKPIIVCEGARNELDMPSTDGFLNVAARSTRTGPDTFRFPLDTQDFKLNIPKDEPCEFEVILRDEYGFTLTLSEDVIFSYAEDESKFASIRGNGVDILNYLHSILMDIKRGYNIISFRVDNNEEFAKELSITMTSRELGMNVQVNQDLDAGDETSIDIPLFISKDLNSGYYPVRISVYDGETKQTRYTYIHIK